MSSDTQASPQPAPGGDRGLPPVAPPSGKLMVQLFVVPGLIVGLIVLVLLGFYWMFGGARSPEGFLEKLDSSNPDVRWRAASDLSQILPRDDELASNVPFALQLSLRLERVLDANVPMEEELARRLPGLSSEDQEREKARVQADRDFLQYLSGCLGRFLVPVTAPVLRRMAEETPAIDPAALAARRRQALFALANLGESATRLDGLPEARKEKVLADLREASQQTGVSAWALETLDHVNGRIQGQPDAMGMDQTIATCARADDPVLREYASFCARFWYGGEEENGRIEAALLELCRDTGKGEDLREKLSGPDPSGVQEILGRPGFIIQANAALALASRGSPATPTDLLAEMLDEEKLQKLVQAQEVDRDTGTPRPETRRPNQGKINMILFTTLQAIQRLHARSPQVDLSPLEPLVAKLAGHATPEIKETARQVQSGVFSAKG